MWFFGRAKLARCYDIVIEVLCKVKEIRHAVMELKEL